MGTRQRLLTGGLAAFVASGLIILSGRLDLAPEVVLPLATSGGVVALIIALGAARGGILGLLLMATLNRYTAELAGTSVKPEHIAVPIVAILLLPRVRTLVSNLRPVDFLLLAWLGWSVVGGLLNAPDPADSTRLWIMLLLVAACYFAVVATVRTAGRLIVVVESWLVLNSAVGIFGIISHVFYAWDINLGIQINPITADPTVPATFRESNLFGSAMMMLTLAALGLLLLGYRRRHVPVIAAVVGFVGLQLSFARTAWIAFVIGLLILAALLLLLAARDAYRFGPALLRPVGVVAGASVLATALVWLPVGDTGVRSERDNIVAENATREAQVFASMTAGAEAAPATLPPLQAGTPTVLAVPTPSPENPDIVGRVGSIADTSDSSLQIRIDFARQALRDWRAHPFVGRGIGSFGQTYTTTSFDRAWLSNTFVRTLHDGGLIGFGLFLAPLAMLASAGLRLTDHISGGLDQLALALGVAVAGMFVAFQATEGFQLAWYWSVLGLYAAAVRLAHERRARETAV